MIFKSVQKPPGLNIVLFSHVACAETTLTWKLKDGQGFRGGAPSEQPRIEFVTGSLQQHKIKYVDYNPTTRALPECSPAD